MDSPLSSIQEALIDTSEAFSLACLLERGIDCTRQGCYVEGLIYFSRARERLSSNQMHLAVILDAFIQSHADYLQAQQLLQIASKRFVEADTEQQTQLAALKKLLPALREDMDRMPQLQAMTLSSKNQWECQPPRLPQLSIGNSSIEQPPLPSHSPTNKGDALPALYFTCFGHFEVRRLNQTIILCSNRNGQIILRYLIAQQGHSATIDTLMALLWPEDEPEVAQPKLHIAISALRRSLNAGYSCEPGGGYILCKNRVYYLNSQVVIQTDIDDFLRYYQMGQQMSEKRVALYERACLLYTGPFLSEDLYADWSFLQREHLSKTYLAMCRELADYYLHLQRYEDAAKWATAILKENRCDEAAHRYLMQVYAAQGRRSEALQQYQRCASILHEELGVLPLPETTHLFKMMLTNEPSSAHKAKI